jgi:hypothetical protein
MITKSGGCNHMKCVCGTNFCWLCGKQVEDTVFPRHFQWWNANGCANMQMANEIEPSLFTRVSAYTLTFLQLVTLGPLSAVSTLVSACVCLPCVGMYVCATDDDSSRTRTHALWRTRLNDLWTQSLTVWGYVYLFMLVILPCLILGGGLFVGVCVVCYPLYAIIRIAHKQYPWPDTLTHCSRRVYTYIRRSMQRCYYHRMYRNWVYRQRQQQYQQQLQQMSNIHAPTPPRPHRRFLWSRVRTNNTNSTNTNNIMGGDESLDLDLDEDELDELERGVAFMTRRRGSFDAADPTNTIDLSIPSDPSNAANNTSTDANTNNSNSNNNNVDSNEQHQQLMAQQEYLRCRALAEMMAADAEADADEQHIHHTSISSARRPSPSITSQQSQQQQQHRRVFPFMIPALPLLSLARGVVTTATNTHNTHNTHQGHSLSDRGEQTGDAINSNSNHSGSNRSMSAAEFRRLRNERDYEEGHSLPSSGSSRSFRSHGSCRADGGIGGTKKSLSSRSVGHSSSTALPSVKMMKKYGSHNNVINNSSSSGSYSSRSDGVAVPVVRRAPERGTIAGAANNNGTVSTDSARAKNSPREFIDEEEESKSNHPISINHGGHGGGGSKDEPSSLLLSSRFLRTTDRASSFISCSSYEAATTRPTSQHIEETLHELGQSMLSEGLVSISTTIPATGVNGTTSAINASNNDHDTSNHEELLVTARSAFSLLSNDTNEVSTPQTPFQALMLDDSIDNNGITSTGSNNHNNIARNSIRDAAAMVIDVTDIKLFNIDISLKSRTNSAEAIVTPGSPVDRASS